MLMNGVTASDRGHRLRICQRQRGTRMNIINAYYTFIGCNYDIFSQFLFNSCLGKINNFHLNRKVKQQNPDPPPPPHNVPGTFLRTKSISESSLNWLKNQIIENINGNMLEEIKNCWIGGKLGTYNMILSNKLLGSCH